MAHVPRKIQTHDEQLNFTDNYDKSKKEKVSPFISYLHTKMKSHPVIPTKHLFKGEKEKV